MGARLAAGGQMILDRGFGHGDLSAWFWPGITCVTPVSPGVGVGNVVMTERAGGG